MCDASGGHSASPLAGVHRPLGNWAHKFIGHVAVVTVLIKSASIQANHAVIGLDAAEISSRRTG